MKSLLLAALPTAGSSMAFAQEGDGTRTIEELASQEGVQKVAETLSTIGCAAGQSDIKLTGDDKTIVMSIDEWGDGAARAA